MPKAVSEARKYAEMNRQELEQEIVKLKAEYKKYQEMELSLNMARGKPCREQLDLSMGMMDALNSEADLSCADGTDCRNYGVLTGIEEAKILLKAHPDWSNDSIADACGFGSRSYFQTVFKENTGMTPAQFVESSPTD